MSMPLAHRLRHGGVDGVGGGRACGADLDRVSGEVGEEGGGHLGAAGVVDADEEDAGPVGGGSAHGGVPSWAAGQSNVGAAGSGSP